MKVAVLAVQGAFIEHQKKLENLGVSCIELRKKDDLEENFDGLILPGGESTVQGKLLKELGMYPLLKEKIVCGMPVLATCAGLILLAEKLTNDQHVYFGTLPVKVKRNAYGRQLGSFHLAIFQVLQSAFLIFHVFQGFRHFSSRQVDVSHFP